MRISKSTGADTHLIVAYERRPVGQVTIQQLGRLNSGGRAQSEEGSSAHREQVVALMTTSHTNGVVRTYRWPNICVHL